MRTLPWDLQIKYRYARSQEDILYLGFISPSLQFEMVQKPSLDRTRARAGDRVHFGGGLGKEASDELKK